MYQILEFFLHFSVSINYRCLLIGIALQVLVVIFVSLASLQHHGYLLQYSLVLASTLNVVTCDETLSDPILI